MRTFQSRSSNGLSWAGKPPKFIPVYSPRSSILWRRLCDFIRQPMISESSLTELEIVRVGLAETWRRGLPVVMRR
jgi:hypothetical protein